MCTLEHGIAGTCDNKASNILLNQRANLGHEEGCYICCRKCHLSQWHNTCPKNKPETHKIVPSTIVENISYPFFLEKQARTLNITVNWSTKSGSELVRIVLYYLCCRVCLQANCRLIFRASSSSLTVHLTPVGHHLPDQPS